MIKRFFVILLLPVFLFSIEVSGTVSGVWGIEDSPYLVTGDLLVTPYTSLTIDPGVQVLFMDDYDFRVEGELHAIGTEQDYISFMSYLGNVEVWQGIDFQFSTGLSEISYAYFYHTSGPAVYSYYSNPINITSSVFGALSGEALHFEDTFSDITLTDLVIASGPYSPAIRVDNSKISMYGLDISGPDNSDGIYYNSGYPLIADNINVTDSSIGLYLVASQNSENLITNSSFEYNAAHGVRMDNSVASFDSCQFNNNLGNGFYSEGFSNIGISNSDFSENNEHGIYFRDPSSSYYNIVETSVHNNNEHGIFVYYNNNTSSESTLNIIESLIYSNQYGVLINQPYQNTKTSYSVINTEIHDNSGSAFYVQHDSSNEYNQASTQEFIGCYIYDNAYNGIMTNTGGNWWDYARPSITNCIIKNNGSHALHHVGIVTNCLVTGNGGWGIDGSYADVVNSTIASNSSGLNSVSNVYNSISFFNDSNQIGSAGSVTYSAVMGGYEGEGNIDQNPGFWDYVNFELHPSSPCIDAGNPSADYYDICFPPSQGAATNDMGVYGGLGACSFIEPVEGCLDESALNYNPDANIDDGSCEYLLYGDLNADDAIDVLDVVTMVNQILDDAPYQDAADMNLDGNIDVLDIVALVNLIMEINNP